MDDIKEDASFKSLSHEELYEEAEDKEERLCISSKCIFARWIKPAKIHQLMFVSKEVLLIHVGKTLIFYNLRTKKEDLLVVGGNKMTPAGGDALPLDGIRCVDCCDIDLLALAEQPPKAKVIICRYPDLKVLTTLIDSNNSAVYKSVLFLRLEYLIGLRDYPAFDLIIWAWRIQEKLFVVNTEFIQPNQHLILSATGREVYLSQMERDVRCKLQLWTVFISCKTVFANKTQISLPDNVNVESSCWTPSGWFVFCDASTNVYRTQPGTSNSEMCIESTGNYSELCAPLMCPTKQGFMMSTVGNLTCFKDTKGVFTKIWTIAVNHILQSIVVAGENDVYGWSDQGALIELTQKKVDVLKLYGTNIKYFTFIKPTDEIIATINEKNTLQLWDVSTGKHKMEIELNGVATNICSNPLFSYIVISFKYGKIELLRINSKGNGLEYISKIVLCDEELSTVQFLFEGKSCMVTSFPTGRFYYINIKLGQMCSVIKEYHSGKQIVDTEIIDKKRSFFLTVLYKNQKITEVSGNIIVIYDLNFNIVFEFNNSKFYYTSIFKWISCDEQDIINIACTIMLSKQIQSLKINVIKAKVLEQNNIQLDHKLRSVKVSSGKNHYVTFSYDGTYNLYEFDEDGQWKKIITVNCSHWQTGGLIAAQVDVNAQNILTLSHQGNLMCTSFMKTCNHNRRFYDIDVPIIITNKETKGIGFEDALETSKRMTWTMINANNELSESKVTYHKHINYINEEFNKIKNELLTLLEININGPEDTKINIEEFDLNIDYRLEFREKCEIERQEYELKIRDDIKKIKIETENILLEHWESLFIKPKSIYCLKKIYKVDNYPISIVDQEVIEKGNAIIEKRNLNKDEDEYLSSLDTPFSRVNMNILDDETLNNENNEKTLLGSNSYKIVDIIEQMNFQYNYHKLDMAKDEQILLQFMINKLKHSFNKLFDDMFIEKELLLDTLKGYNDRLRVIETEFILACKIEPTEPSPIDYEWNQYEKTEQLIRVDDDEVTVKLYNVLNKQMTVEDTLNEIHNTQLSDLEKFRQQALMNMMDGVLEKRWEDELKKDVPKPQCMLTKEIENYTEEDFKAMNQYEDLVVNMNNERMKYKKILEEEQIKIIRHINESIEKFDDSVFNLFQTKLKYNSAINQEHLKIVRLSKMLSDSEQRKRQIQIYEETCLEMEKNMAKTTKQIEKTETTNSFLLNTIETLNYKNNVLNKRFKSELPSKLIYDQALIAYNRRPKVLGSKIFSPLIGYQFVNTIMDPSNDKLDLLCPEFAKYLDTLRIYDDFKYVDDYKLNMDRETWQKVCNFRRIKIESEFKISTFQKDAMDKSNLLDTLMRDKRDIEIMIEKLKLSISQLENQEYIYEDDPELQLVIKQGNAEINLTGHITDFHNTTLITKNLIEDVNAEIKDMGKSKIDVLSKLMAFKRKCRVLKWEHTILKKYKIALYKYRYDFITSMKITENIIHYLKFKVKGINIAKDAEQKVYKELTAIHTTYSREKNELLKRLDELVNKISNVKKENEKIDKNINQMQIQLSEAKKKIDYSLTNRLILIRDIRMKNIVKRAQLITNIQELHKEIIELNIELELLLLKTFPTLYNTPKSSSKTK